MIQVNLREIPRLSIIAWSDMSASRSCSICQSIDVPSVLQESASGQSTRRRHPYLAPQTTLLIGTTVDH